MTSVPAWALALVPGLEHGEEPLRVEALGGGTVNIVHRIDTRAGRFVLRLDGPAWRRPGVDRDRELELHQTAAAAGIAPRIVLALPGRCGLVVSEYQDGRLWSAQDYADPARLRQLAERLSELHRLSVPAIEPFDPLRVGRDYARLIAPEHTSGLADAMRQLERACALVQASERVPTVVHGDPWEGNLLQGDRLWLLDWEYAQVTDPLMDIACLLAYYPQARAYQADVLAAAGFDARELQGSLQVRVDIYRMLSWLWHLARGEPLAPIAALGEGW